tara:strand:+ start:1554 stop:3722 length:2169 start_codon:yes stop_codon:yes gene_type:complete
MPRFDQVCVLLILILSLVIDVHSYDGLCSNLSGAALHDVVSNFTDTGVNAVDEDSPNERSFHFFAQLVDIGLESHCNATLRNLGSSSTAKTLVLISDGAFERASAKFNLTLEQMSENPRFVCDVLQSSVIYGSLDLRSRSDGDELETASTIMNTVRVEITQNVNIRKMRIFSDFSTIFADVFATDMVLCPQLRGAFISELLIPLTATFVFPSVLVIAQTLPALSISAEAFLATETLRNTFETNEYNLPNSGASSVRDCTFNESHHGFRGYFIPSNQAWKRFFLKTHLTKEEVFADQFFLLSVLLYGETQLFGAQAPVSLASYLSTSFTQDELLRPTGASSILSTLPGQIEVGTLRLDVDIAAIRSRFIKVTAPRVASRRFENAAVVVVSDILSCTGVVHVTDDVLIPPTLTAFRQLSLRNELSIFTEMLRAPVNSEILLELDTPTESNIFVDSVVFAPTDYAIRLMLNYVGWTLVDLFQPHRANLLQQFVTYHIMSTRTAQGTPERIDFRVGLGPDVHRIATRLNYPILSKSDANRFTGTSVAKTINVLSRRHSPTKFKLFQSRVTLQGRLNTAKFIERDVLSTNGVFGIIDSALIPPTDEFRMSLYDRVLRTTTLRVFREITSTLGLERELIVHGFGEGDSTVFAPNDKAWLLTLAELMMTGEEAMNHATAVLYDIIMLMVSSRQIATNDVESEFYDPWQSKDARHGDVLTSVLSTYTTVR